MDLKDDVARDYYRKGIWVIKEHIKELAAIQKKEKAILRMPRKTQEDRAAIKEALEKTDCPWKDTSSLQCRCTLRRPKITAFLTLYAEIRNKPNCNPPGKEYHMPSFSSHLIAARRMFEKATTPAVPA
jgi:hypothetical protein